MEGFNFKLYADDTVLYQNGVNAYHASLYLQKCLEKFCEWCSVNRLSINTKKTKLMGFGSTSRVKKANRVGVFMHGDKLQQVSTFKYLGVVLDPTLNYNHYIKSGIRTMIHKMTLLSKMKENT